MRNLKAIPSLCDWCGGKRPIFYHGKTVNLCKDCYIFFKTKIKENNKTFSPSWDLNLELEVLRRD